MQELIWLLGMVGIYRTLFYAIGDPHDEYNPQAILSSYTAVLGELRLRFLNAYDQPNYTPSASKEEEIMNQQMYKSYIVNRAKPMAGMLNAIGYCSTCTSVWFMLFAVWIPTGDVALYGISLLISKIVFKWI
jgi:hypothetical protein